MLHRLLYILPILRAICENHVNKNLPPLQRTIHRVIFSHLRTNHNAAFYFYPNQLQLTNVSLSPRIFLVLKIGEVKGRDFFRNEKLPLLPNSITFPQLHVLFFIEANHLGTLSNLWRTLHFLLSLHVILFCFLLHLERYLSVVVFSL